MTVRPSSRRVSMSARACRPLLSALLPTLLLVGCTPPEGALLGSLVDAMADETGASASPPISASLVMGGTATALCAGDDSDWSGRGAGDAPPFPESLNEALGAPLIESASRGTALSVTLSGVTLLGYEEVSLAFTSEAQGAGTSFLATASKDDVPFGSVALSVRAGCDSDEGVVEGELSWTDAIERTHTVLIPADATAAQGLSFGGDTVWLPLAGALRWSAEISGEDRDIVTTDALALRVDEGSDPPTALWTATAEGDDWSQGVDLIIDP